MTLGTLWNLASADRQEAGMPPSTRDSLAREGGFRIAHEPDRAVDCGHNTLSFP